MTASENVLYSVCHGKDSAHSVHVYVCACAFPLSGQLPEGSQCVPMCIYMYMYLLAVTKGSYLEAKVVEEVVGSLGLVSTATANKIVA